MSEIQEFLIYMQLRYLWLIVIVYVVQRCILALYYKVFEYDKWWIALIPFGHLFCKHELGAVRYFLLVPTGVFAILAGYTMDIIFLTVCFALQTISELKYSKVFVDSCNAYLWTFVPFVKYVVMIKEVITYARDESR